ncbi:D-2-hydroxyacid dehydrogenase [Acinetobacter terrestris]|jgi:glycerate dehydrogenase|uniref:D-2-hydroxyacid dehydrogenase n=1 Tax=Acinetobacter terrestris TaxID=2529843 RepID=A0AAW6UVX8_9GAMM|nr:D-2-hydroxyacid dehydrogenase [Acinetobacter terrestris]MDK1685065.1 D-2-hydroxyacid dehydrogenase [Acinetobacter terrestris]NNH35503.1 D-2-hydroxyacid dehydrogenase [Acinetobacter terrestris]TCB61134.1 D-2-hydroxyacid dehydrogenase [Acinetobacter terrestris]
MKTLKITCAEKGVLINKAFSFDFPVEYTEYEQLSQQQFYHQVRDQDVIIISDLKVDEQILENNPNLKLLALCSTGYDHVNVDLLKSKNVKICNIRGYAGDAVAEHAFILMMNLIKNFGVQLNAVQSRAWSEGSVSFYLAAPMRELNNKTLAILGKGEIGKALAEKAQAFGMNVIFSERKNAEKCREGYVPFEQAIQQADILSLHCELNDETRGMIDQNVLKQMKKDSILINVGRGGLVNNQDVVQALKNNEIAGFGADVLDQEPPAQDHPLLNINHPNVMITAHIAWATDEAQERLFSIIESNINQNIKGHSQNLI